MNFNQFTLKAQEAVQKAHELTAANSQQQIGTAHLLTGLMMADENAVPYLLKKMGVNTGLLQEEADQIVQAEPRVTGGDIYLSRESNDVLQKALGLLKRFGDEFVSVEHILLALTMVNDATGKLLKRHGVDASSLESAIKEMRKGATVNSQTAEDGYNALNRYARNLNELARDGKLDPVIGRDDEIRRVLQILSRRTKNNPILIGEPGVGKTAIAEGLAHRIINGDVPENLKNKVVYSLDMGSLVAGAKYKGEFEERLKSVVKEVISAEGEIILFIDEIHTLVGAGAGEGAMDAANILKPALARGELRAIGATTLKEYQKYFEKDKALERRFQIVLVDEPDTASAISILRGLKERYETHHHVRILDEAIVAAVELSQRYISDRFLPDKAIDLMDEAASRLRLEINSLPEELEAVERKIRQLEIEREAIRREGDKQKLKELSEELANLNDDRNRQRAQWQAEKGVVEAIQHQKQAIEQFKAEAEKAEREGDYGKVAELRYGRVREAEEELKSLKQKLTALQGDHPMINEEVSAEEIAQVVSKWTGIPVTRMLQSEREKLLRLEMELHKRVIGQDEAIGAVADAIRRSRAGLQDSRRPVGSFIFLGSTGVGKTELARALAEFMFNDESNMVRIDMSEYQERHSVSRLIGAPPGYVGYDESGQLTEAVRRKPYSVILLDEIEKAHPDVFNILLQVLDDGRLTDNKGRTADFRNTVIIMTSNIGSGIIQEKLSGLDDSNRVVLIDETRELVLDLLKKTLRPEFLNRIDEVITFTPLTFNEIRQIVVLQLNQLKNKLAEKDVVLEYTGSAIDFIAKAGFDPQFGARPIRRMIQREVLNQLSRYILQGKLVAGSPVVLDSVENQLVFTMPS